MAIEPSFSFSLGGMGIYPTLQASAVAGLQPLIDDFGLFCEVLERDVLPTEIFNALEPTLEKARDVYCPIEKGTLRASAYLDVEPGPGGNVTAEMGFGKDGFPDYAISVHENPAAFHEPPTQYKFLERAVYEDTVDIMDRIYAGVKSRLGL